MHDVERQCGKETSKMTHHEPLPEHVVEPLYRRDAAANCAQVGQFVVEESEIPAMR